MASMIERVKKLMYKPENIRNIGIVHIIAPNAYNTKKCYSHITILNTYNSKQNTKKLLVHTS